MRTHDFHKGTHQQELGEFYVRAIHLCVGMGWVTYRRGNGKRFLHLISRSDAMPQIREYGFHCVFRSHWHHPATHCVLIRHRMPVVTQLTKTASTTSGNHAPHGGSTRMASHVKRHSLSTSYRLWLGQMGKNWNDGGPTSILSA